MNFTDGETYRPSNGTEGEMFMDYFCCNCEHEWDNPDEACLIMLNAVAFDIDDPNYPKDEWIYMDNQPTCKSFELKEGEYLRKYRCPDTIDMFEKKNDT